MPTSSRRLLLQLTLIAPLTAALVACGRKATSTQRLPNGATVLALGDSLTAGVGARAGEDWPSQLADLTGWAIDNAGVSGDTSAQALQRLPGLLQGKQHDAILIGIGGNDFLRQLPLEQTMHNITQLLAASQGHCAHVGLIATPEPRLLAALTGSLDDAPLYAELADRHNALLLKGVYAEVLSKPQWRSDQVHANASGYARMAQLLLAQLQTAGWI